MSSKVYDVQLILDFERLPEESGVIENLIINGTLGTFLYTVVNDCLEGRYDLQAGHMKIILDKLIETVSAIFSTVGSMDNNIQTITEILNDHTDMLAPIRNATKMVINPNQSQTLAFEEASAGAVEASVGVEKVEADKVEELTPTIQAKDLILDYGEEESDGDLEISEDLLDLFGDLSMDSGVGDF